jgi:hypothetical protein
VSRLGMIGWAALAVGLVQGLLVVDATAACQPVPAVAAMTIQVLSNRPDLISGGDALVGVFPGAGVGVQSLRVTADARDVTGELQLGRVGGLLAHIPQHNRLGVTEDSNALVGLITGLHVGPNLVRAQLPDGSGAQITIVDHPAGGPVFAGPQVKPWSCAAGALDAQCDRPPTYQYFYMPAASSDAADPSNFVGGDPRFQPYDPSNPPSSSQVAQTTTDGGQTVPFIVRVETGTIDRGQYNIGVLYDPTGGWSPWSPQPGWNHKLLLLGGPSCGMSYQEGSAPDVRYARALRAGFAVMSNALEVTGSDCNLVVQAESLMMTKEHLIEAYGLVRYTMGLGGSGASLVQQWIANAYPGIYDGLIPQASFADAWTPLRKADDCIALLRYWDDPSLWGTGVAWAAPQEVFVLAGGAPSTCPVWQQGFQANFTPADETGQVPTAQVYNATTNPCGVRGDLADYGVSQLGRRPSSVWTGPEKACGSGFANRPLNNVGVQYGLDALLAGEITPAQFADLNAKIGGHDIDYAWQPQRTQADPAAVAALFRSGYVNEANNVDVPIVDQRSLSSVELHDTYNSYSMRSRLDRARGTHANQVIWTAQEASGFVVDPVLEAQAFDLMNRWLAAIEADTSISPLAHKVIADKPVDAVDRCTLAGGAPAPCVTPPSGEARLGAGEPLVDDNWLCQLKPLVRADYPLTFTDPDWAALQQAFPAGVCDYSKPSVDQQPTVAWLTYDEGPGGVALPPVEQSRAVAGTATASAGCTLAAGGAAPNTAATAPPSPASQVVLVLVAAIGIGRLRRRRYPWKLSG